MANTNEGDMCQTRVSLGGKCQKETYHRAKETYYVRAFDTLVMR
jgi:hypothetical protein